MRLLLRRGGDSGGGGGGEGALKEFRGGFFEVMRSFSVVGAWDKDEFACCGMPNVVTREKSFATEDHSGKRGHIMYSFKHTGTVGTESVEFYRVMWLY
jgi:hypothetical protein